MVMPRVVVQRGMRTCLMRDVGLCINHRGVVFEFVLRFQYGVRGVISIVSRCRTPKPPLEVAGV